MKKHKRCPFCDETPLMISEREGRGAGAFVYFMRCNFCSAQGPKSTSITKAFGTWDHRATSPSRKVRRSA